MRVHADVIARLMKKVAASATSRASGRRWDDDKPVSLVRHGPERLTWGSQVLVE